jgi:hypothetical protein
VVRHAKGGYKGAPSLAVLKCSTLFVAYRYEVRCTRAICAKTCVECIHVGCRSLDATECRALPAQLNCPATGHMHAAIGMHTMICYLKPHHACPALKMQRAGKPGTPCSGLPSLQGMPINAAWDCSTGKRSAATQPTQVADGAKCRAVCNAGYFAVKGAAASWEASCKSGAFTKPAPTAQAPQELVCGIGTSPSRQQGWLWLWQPGLFGSGHRSMCACVWQVHVYDSGSQRCACCVVAAAASLQFSAQGWSLDGRHNSWLPA